DVGEIARLNIAQRLELPVAPADHPQAGVLTLARGVGALETQRAVVAEYQPPRLQLDRLAQRRDPPHADRPATECGAGGRGHAVLRRGGEEALAAVPPPVDDDEPGAEIFGQAQARFGLAAVVGEQRGG